MMRITCVEDLVKNKGVHPDDVVVIRSDDFTAASRRTLRDPGTQGIVRIATSIGDARFAQTTKVIHAIMGDKVKQWDNDAWGFPFANSADWDYNDKALYRLLLAIFTAEGKIKAECKTIEINGHDFCVEKIYEALKHAGEDC